MFSIALAILVFAADTWLHVTMKTTEFVQVTTLPTEIDYSLGLALGCAISNNSYNTADDNYQSQYNLSPAVTNTFSANSSTSLQVLNNVSDSMVVLTYNATTPYNFLGVPPSDTVAARDWTAYTFGMSTQCKIISEQCDLHEEGGASTPFNCTNAFVGDLASGGAWENRYFTDETMSDNLIRAVSNPYYFAIAANANSGGGGTIQADGTEIVRPGHGGDAFVLLCTTTVYDVQYDTVNSTVTHFVPTISNDSTSNIWQGSMIFVGSPGDPMLQQAENLATFSKITQELADKIALAYSKVALAIGAQGVTPRPALQAQERHSRLATRVEAAPLFTLVGAHLLFVIIGIVLTILELATSGGEVRGFQARLSIVGIVADRFERWRGVNGVHGMDHHFEEKFGNGNMRVAIDMEGGNGYGYNVWPGNGNK
ncbi:hypothetical protein G7Y89_g4016 [Cudoniella acicularis]|uniref:Uncharacterized protein n=1 Tax=Cudoniella acicularis TaxID=354080 RepID=A0A8H4W531_9HELO|nr:hypothetical protein G7Y89_g4016 [Cudoniella acicularis]